MFGKKNNDKAEVVAKTTDAKAAAKTDAKDAKKDPAKKSRKPFQFFRNVISELKKVTWPTRRALVIYTAVVLLMSAVMAIILGATDLGLTKLMELVVG